MTMVFLQPEYFLLIPAFALAGAFWRGLRLYSPLRLLILLTAATLLAEPRVRTQKSSLDLHVLLDRSASTEDLVDKGLPEWRRLLEESKPRRRDRLHFYNYAEEIAELGIDGSAFTGSRLLTRTGLALSTVASRIDSKRPSRVLLFTDGHATEPLQEAAAQLQAQGIPLDYRLIRDDGRTDFRISRLDFPERVQAGEPFLLSVHLRGPGNATVPLILRRDGRTLTETSVTLKDGSGSIEFTDRLGRSGSFEYEAEIRPERDAHAGNNRAHRWIEVTAGPRLLLVTRYADDPVAEVLSALDFEVETVLDPGQLQPGRLSGARAVILNNVPAHEIPADFLESLDFFVREQGGGLLMAGGERSFGSGGYFQSSIDALLPVSMELKNEHRKLTVALAIVLDRSGSMAVSVAGAKTKMDLANAGAANAIDLLGQMDQVTVFAVDSEPTKVIPLTTIGSRKAEITHRVRRITSAGGGIYIYNGLKAAWDELKASPAGTRHVILFSDAQDSEEPGDYKKLLQEMKDGGATVSVIGLGTDKDVDAALLQEIAALGGGRVFFSDRPADLPKIFAQETVTIARSAFIKDPVQAQPTGRWSDISPQSIEWPRSVDGYNLSYARPDATVSLLSADEYVAPLIAHSRRGLGRTMAVSFPLGGEFSETVRAWPGYGDFLQTAARFLMGQDTPPGIALRPKLDGTRLSLDLLYDTDLWAEKFATDPPKVRLQEKGGQPFDLTWRRIAPGRFSLTRDLDEGSVVRGAVQVAGHALAFGPMSAGSSLEWNFDAERILELRAASNQTRGRELLDLSQAWLRPPATSEASLSLPLGIALLVLVLLEALVTRTGWRLPEFALPKRSPSARKVKAAKPKRAVKAETPLSDPVAPVLPPTDHTERSDRFQRAKKRQ